MTNCNETEIEQIHMGSGSSLAKATRDLNISRILHQLDTPISLRDREACAATAQPTGEPGQNTMMSLNLGCTETGELEGLNKPEGRELPAENRSRRYAEALFEESCVHAAKIGVEA